MPASYDHLPNLPDDVFVIDPVIHALNLDRSNIASKYGEQLYQMSYGLHAMLSPPEALCSQEVYMTDMAPEALVRTIFEESQTRLAATHTLRLDTWFKDGFAAEWKTVEMTTRWPTRVLGYVGLDPTQDCAAVLEDLERQVAATPNAIGVKLYPHQMDPYRHWLTNDDTVMRLIERARSRGRTKRGGGMRRVLFEDLELAGPEPAEDVEVVHEALERLAEIDPDGVEVVKLRYFVGLSVSQAAEVLGRSERTVKRQWSYARAWLKAEIEGHDR